MTGSHAPGTTFATCACHSMGEHIIAYRSEHAAMTPSFCAAVLALASGAFFARAFHSVHVTERWYRNAPSRTP